MLLPCSLFCIKFKYIRQLGISDIGEFMCACLSFNEWCACVDNVGVKPEHLLTPVWIVLSHFPSS